VSDLPGFSSVDYASNAAYYVRKGTPAAIRANLNDALGNALATAEVKGTLEADGRRVARKMTIEQAEAFYREEVRKYEEVIRLTGFQPLD
jgi:tripartite-type tricarboxylate transporter receptor subunit TctC